MAEKSCLIWRRRAWSVTCETHDRYVLTKALIRVFTLHALETALLQLAQRVDSASMASWGVEKRSRFFVDMLKRLSICSNVCSQLGNSPSDFFQALLCDAHAPPGCILTPRVGRNPFGLRAIDR